MLLACSTVSRNGTNTPWIVAAEKEVILAAGAIDSPRILLLSGVGPASDLENLGIPVVRDMPGVGQSLTDRPAGVLAYQMHDGFSDRQIFDADPAAFASAVESFNTDGTGPLNLHYSSLPTAYLKHDDMASWQSFSQIPDDAQDLLLKPSVPHFELAMVSRVRLRACRDIC